MVNCWATGVLAASQQAASTDTALQWWATGGVALAFLIALVLISYQTRAGMIARATTKEAIRQPVFLLLLVIGIVTLVLNTVLPVFGFGEDVKMFKDCGLATILVSGLFLAVWTASTSVAAEIEGKTAMTLLSKPINRRQFVFGKYCGIVQAVLLLMVILSVCLLALIYAKVGYDAKESSKTVPEWFEWMAVGWLPFDLPMLTGERLSHMIHVVPGLVLIFLEVAILAAVSVAISTRLPMVMNITTCFAVFVIGHLTPVLVKTVFQQLEYVKFTAQSIATVLPALDLFNTQAVVATGTLIPPVYLGYAAIYSAVYCTAAILTAFILFEDRDLA